MIWYFGKGKKAVGCYGVGSIIGNGCCDLFIMHGRQTSAIYIQVMENVMLPYAKESPPPSWIYQQDNAPIHNSIETIQWFSENSVKRIGWSARALDLNPMKRV